MTRIHLQHLSWTPVVAGLVLLAILGQIVPVFYAGLLIQVMILGIFAMSLNLLMGYTGMLSLGHSAFFGAAAYATAIFSLRVDANFWWNAPAGVLVSVGVAAIFAPFVLRSSGAYFLMITLAFAQVLWGVAFSWDEMTGGIDGLPGISRPDLGILPSVTATSSYFYFALIVFAVVMMAMYLLVRSGFGYALQGIRENEVRMQALGYNTWRYRYLAYVLAAFFAGIAGVVFVYFNGFVSTNELGVLLSAEALLMVILGGNGTLYGPVIGAAILVFLEDYLSSHTARWVLVLGLIYVTAAVFAPRGILVLARRLVLKGLRVGA